MLKKIIFFVFAFVATESAFADSASLSGIQIDWTTNIPAQTPSNQKQTSENSFVQNTTTLHSTTTTTKTADPRTWLLPTSHFYFLKNWRRAFERLTTFNEKKRIDLELSISDEILNEIKIIKNKLREVQTHIDVGRADTDRALNAYAKAHRIMRERTTRIWEKLTDSDRDALLDKIANQISEHSKIFAGTTNSLNTNSEKIKPLIDAIKLDLQETTEELMKHTNAQLFASKLSEIAKSTLQNEYSLTTTPRVGFFDRLIKKVSDIAQSILQKAKTDILNAITEKLKSL